MLTAGSQHALSKHVLRILLQEAISVADSAAKAVAHNVNSVPRDNLTIAPTMGKETSTCEEDGG